MSTLVKSITILGSTGSVGQNTIKVLESQEQDFDIIALTAYENVALLAEQAVKFNTRLAVIGDASKHDDLREALKGTNVKTACGEDGLIEAASLEADWTMAAITGMAGLEPLMASIQNGNIIAIANKEPLVAAGDLVLKTAKETGATLLPVDSEHNAIFQVLEPNNHKAIERLILTASGGPFRTMSLTEMEDVTPEQALAHPNWSMGDKISIDSATMMNKALEVIEAQKLFNVRPNQIEVLVHPQSIVHSMVEYQDGSVLAQMGASDMCTPITNTLGYPSRLKTPGQTLDFTQMKRFDFEALDEERFPTIRLAYECLEQGQCACIALNASNEVAVSAFLNHKIAFLDIYKVIKHMVTKRPTSTVKTLKDIISYDNTIRNLTESYIVSGELKQAKTA